MRVIAGENKGRQLKSVASRLTRPTTDKVKETIFNMIGPYFQGGKVLDLYGGSGGLGLEALSRGAEYAVFVDKAGAACKVMEENARHCGCKDRCDILHRDAGSALEQLAKRGEIFDYVFLDPPYAKQHLEGDIMTMLEKRMLSNQAIIVAEHEDTAKLPDSFEPGMVRWKYRTYQGKTAVSIYCFQHENQGSVLS
ncbi:16S rRNA (guanine(966)-N(2))-methyltransferase RsmD [Sporolactobacillus pectinivorans]|uniref:16S rRNA (guanine(966)-N(2))-methyltransferase RsmD n=1 Tax=Sporolactobacillus pectinivorans TaxID=1591408 RepID=UPI000C25BC5A|nr:16S rRNA (guanine(966)-N(2))-methyltransferase RsmD [Sporolactobacillus pectinivorans]